MSDPFRDVEEKERTEPTDEAKYWAKELDLARKRQSGYRKDAEEVVKIYEGESTRENSFNILYSNTETLLPAIYNQLPRPDVGLTFPDDPDQLAKAGAEVLERMLKNITAAQTIEYDQAHRLFQQAVLGGLVPGQGITRWFYDAEIKTKAAPVGDFEHEGAADAAQNPDATVFVPKTEKGKSGRAKSKVHYEFICGKDLDYDQVLYGYARRWVDVPWIGFEHFMHLDDLRANFGKEVADSIDLTAYSKKGHEGWKDKTTVEEGAENHGSQPGAYIVEIWNRAKREIVFYCETSKTKLIGEPRDDPYELTGFYPICEPLKFQKRTSGIVPKPVYKLYEQQAKELNRVSIRINRILNALKVRGFYDGSLGSLKDLLRQDDNTLLPANNASAFYEGKTLDNAIWLMPLDKLITVLQQLWQGREQIKNTIYEITGISDIMRGDTQASETYGAQNLKSKWGTQRLQGFQGEVQRYCRDCFRIIAEMGAKNFGQPTLAKITGLDYATDEEVQQAQKTMQMGQMMMLRMQQQQQPPAPPPGAAPPASQGMDQGAAAGPPGSPVGSPSPAGAPPPPSPPQAPGAPPQPPPIPPQLQQAMQQAQDTLQKLKWSDVIEAISEDISRQYKIDIETNSTIDPTRQQDKQDITDVMTALANTVESFGPLVEQGVIPMPVFKGMLKTIVSRFTFGKRIEQAIDAMPDQVPPTVNNTPDQKGSAAGKPPPSPEEVQADQMEQQNRIKLATAQSGLIDKKMMLEAKQLENDLARQSREGERAQLEHMLEMATLKAKIGAANLGLEQKRQGIAIDTHAKMVGMALDTHAKAQGAAIQTEAARQGAMIKTQAAREGAEISTQAARDGAQIAKQRGQDANKLAKQKGNGQQKR